MFDSRGDDKQLVCLVRENMKWNEQSVLIKDHKNCCGEQAFGWKGNRELQADLVWTLL